MMTCEERNLVIYYMSTRLNYSNRELANMWGLAIGTIRTYCYKLDKEENISEKAENAFYIYQHGKPKASSTQRRDSICYLILLPNEVLKVGKTVNFEQRMNRLSSDYGKITPLLQAEFDNEEDAYLMEVILHKYFKEKYNDCEFFPQDRFRLKENWQDELAQIEDDFYEIRNKIYSLNWFQGLTKPLLSCIIKIQRTKGEKKMRKISPEEREMLIVAENFGCVAEVIAELGITAEEAKEIIWGED